MHAHGNPNRRQRRHPTPTQGDPCCELDELRVPILSPLEAERLGSALVSEVYWHRDPRLRGDEVRGSRYVLHLARGRKPLHAWILQMIASVADPPLARRARAALSRLPNAVPRPRWANAIGQTRVKAAWYGIDSGREMAVAVLSFAYPGGSPGIVVVVIYLNPEPWVHHTMIEPEIEPTLGRIQADSDLNLRPVTVTEALMTVRQALAGVDSMADPPISTDFARDRAFLLALLRREAPD